MESLGGVVAGLVANAALTGVTVRGRLRLLGCSNGRGRCGRQGGCDILRTIITLKAIYITNSKFEEKSTNYKSIQSALFRKCYEN